MDTPKRKSVPLEKQIRNKLSIPSSAQKVLIFGESSHWDPNWLFTTEEYFNMRIRTILDSALEELVCESLRVYSVECVFFLKMYWDKCPDKRRDIKRLVNQGRIRLLGTGMTTPDTILPETEAILRDYLRGYRWLTENGMTQRPRVAYFPDSFGHSPCLPSILESCGFQYAAVTRIDGMGFPGADYRASSYYPVKGSSAWTLLKEHKSLDFVWRSPDGSEVLSHWNSFTYFQGDNIVYVGPTKWMGFLFGLSRRSEGHVAKRIGEYVAQLGPVSKTPYMFCPIGMDFNPPIHGLYSLLEKYNSTLSEKTGVYAVIAGLDDYLDLISCYRETLPVLELDFNPYWMGFYASRPKLKKRCKYLAKDLITAEALSIQAKRHARQEKLQYKAPDLTDIWDKVILTNHHDFITGTSPERVYKKEQRILLEEAAEFVSSVIGSAMSHIPKPPVSKGVKLPVWDLKAGRLSVQSDFYKAVVDEKEGGCITSFVDLKSGFDMAKGLVNDAVSYFDSGGLWRMGHEFAGGKFEISDLASNNKARVFVREMNGLLEVEVRSRLDGKNLVRLMWFRGDSPVIRMKTIGTPRIGHTVTARLSTGLDIDHLHMDVPGGVVKRPALKIFDPTFWAAKSFVHLKDPAHDQGLAVALFTPACPAAIYRGVLELIALRNAPSETAYGILPIMAHPAKGFEPGEQSLNYAIWQTPGGDWRQNRVWDTAEKALRASWLAPHGPDVDHFFDSLIFVDNPGVSLGAVKNPSAGNGLLIRLFSYLTSEKKVKLTFRGARIKKAWLCNTLEDDLAPLKVENGAAEVVLRRHITTVRILLD